MMHRKFQTVVLLLAGLVVGLLLDESETAPVAASSQSAGKDERNFGNHHKEIRVTVGPGETRSIPLPTDRPVRVDLSFSSLTSVVNGVTIVDDPCVFSFLGVLETSTGKGSSVLQTSCGGINGRAIRGATIDGTTATAVLRLDLCCFQQPGEVVTVLPVDVVVNLWY